MATKDITLVCTDTKRALIDWSRASSDDSKVVSAWNMELCKEAITMADSLDINLKRVIFDKTVEADEFLEVIAWLGPDFLGDLVMINSRDSGYMSASSPMGGRVIYRLEKHDVDFYLEALGIESSEPSMETIVPVKLRLVG
ncbi:MAG: hypothetical protein KY459_04885 [Acidobacteria bacterium]|nr:hypothetical protein [Acidobacteriota bacterium]